jgi:adenine-specific DNA methylase
MVWYEDITVYVHAWNVRCFHCKKYTLPYSTTNTIQ